MKSSRFYFKVYVKNIIFILMVVAVSFFSYYHRSVLKTSIYSFSGLSSYSLYCTTIGLMIISTYISGNKYESIKIMQFDENKFFLSNILAGIKAITLLFIIPCIIIFSHIVYLNVNIYTIKEFLNYGITWYSANIFAVVLGATIGVFVNNFLRYIVCIFIYLFLINNSFQLFSLINRFINIFEDKVSVPINYASPVLFNKFYLFDKLFIVFTIFFMIILVYLKVKRKKYRYYIVISIIFLMIQLSIVYTSHSYLNMIKATPEFQNENVNSKEYNIKKYFMDIDVSSKLNNKCSIHLTTNVLKNNKLEFFLSKIFKVRNVFINGKNANYSRIKNKLIIEIDNIEDEELIVDIEYSGNVYAESNLGVHVLYTSNEDISLLDNILSWYPIGVNNQKFYDFHVNIKSKSKIYSNLPKTKEEKNKFHYHTVINGKGSGLNILSGNYDIMEYRGIETIYPQNIKESSAKSFVNDMFGHDNVLRLDKSKIKKIIIIPYYGKIKTVDETILSPLISW